MALIGVSENIEKSMSDQKHERRRRRELAAARESVALAGSTWPAKWREIVMAIARGRLRVISKSAGRRRQSGRYYGGNDKRRWAIKAYALAACRSGRWRQCLSAASYIQI